jgi:hypothetical protein
LNLPAVSFYIIAVLQGYGPGHVMTGIAVLLAIAAIAVTQISKETRGLALDVMSLPTH